MSIATLKSFALAAAVVAPLAGAASVEAQNLLVNPGFESPDASAGDQPGATGFGSFNDAFTTATSPRTGTQAGKAFGIAGFTQSFAASPGDSFVASGFGLNPTGDLLGPDQIGAVNIEFRANPADGEPLQRDSTRFLFGSTPADVYQFGTITGTAPAGTTEARFVLVTGAFDDVNGDGLVQGGGSVRFDDASFSRVVADVPEPAGLAALGLAGGALLRRRR